MKKGLKKVFVLSVIALFLISFLVGVVSAQVPTAGANARTFTQGVVSIVTSAIDIATQAGKPLFEALLGSVGSGGDLFVKVLIFLLVLLVVVAVLDTVELFSGKSWIQYSIGVIISILGIRFLPNDMIQAIAFPSSVFVATVAIGLPFLLFGFALYKISLNMYVRRAGWVLFGVVLLVLWFYNSEKPFFWIYPLFVLGCIVAFWFDGTLMRLWSNASAARTEESISSVSKNTILGEIRQLQSALAGATTEKQMSEIRKQIKLKETALKSLY